MSTMHLPYIINGTASSQPVPNTLATTNPMGTIKPNLAPLKTNPVVYKTPQGNFVGMAGGARAGTYQHPDLNGGAPFIWTPSQEGLATLEKPNAAWQSQGAKAFFHKGFRASEQDHGSPQEYEFALRATGAWGIQVWDFHILPTGVKTWIISQGNLITGTDSKKIVWKTSETKGLHYIQVLSGTVSIDLPATNFIIV